MCDTLSVIKKFSFLFVGVNLFSQGFSQLVSDDGFTRHKYACDSPPSCGTYMYSMECAVGQKIALKALYYGAKPYTSVCPDTQSCVSKTTCCVYHSGDCLIPYSDEKLFDVYKLCSRQLQCGWLFASSIDLKNNECAFRKRTNYIRADFQCIDDQSFVDICSQASVTGKSVHLHHKGLIPTAHNYRQCSCVIAPADCNNTATLNFRVVDLRLHSNDSLTSCTSESRVELIGQNERKIFNCEKNKFLYGFDDFHSSSENGMVLYLYKKDREYPTKVWLEVQTSQPGVDVTVTCGPRSVQTAKRCPALQIVKPGEVDVVEDVPERGYNTPSIVVIDPDTDPDLTDVDIELENKKDNPAIWAIIGGIIAGVVVLILLLVLVCLILRKKKNGRKRSPDTNGKGFPYTDEAIHQVNYYESITPDDSFEKSPTSPTGPRIYHQPWGTEQGIKLNRAKPHDLAYATSEEIKVLIEKMERDRHFLVEGEADTFQQPDPMYYRHISDYRYKPSETETPEGLSEAEDVVEVDSETESKSVMSENCGTEKLESEDSKVEADRAIDSDVDSPKPESETVSAYFDGYESPRVSSFQPSDTSSQRTSVRSDIQSDLGYSKFSKAENVILEDSHSDLDVPLEQAPVPNISQIDDKTEATDSGFKSDNSKSGEVTLGSYRQPKGSIDSVDTVKFNVKDDLDENKTGHYYTAVYDKISDGQTKL